ncbi:hypothetical protein DFH09DRAFT_1094507 [Mycena vulgaris]|nr:hypothetical protein DFH09DRAFT_1094507 [Mycena vulgaris]
MSTTLYPLSSDDLVRISPGPRLEFTAKRVNRAFLRTVLSDSRQAEQRTGRQSNTLNGHRVLIHHERALMQLSEVPRPELTTSTGSFHFYCHAVHRLGSALPALQLLNRAIMLIRTHLNLRVGGAVVNSTNIWRWTMEPCEAPICTELNRHEYLWILAENQNGYMQSSSEPIGRQPAPPMLACQFLIGRCVGRVNGKKQARAKIFHLGRHFKWTTASATVKHQIPRCPFTPEPCREASLK